MQHEQHMHAALELAQCGRGFVEPNPMVGCVIVRHNKIIARGYHTRFGQPHAEVAAIKNADGADLSDATLYVTLEPCSHTGKTPPCVDAILKTGIKNVVTAMRDPNPLVNGKGLQILRQNGISITENVLQAEAERLNAPYLTLLRKKRPWIIGKWSMTLDGKLATRTGNSSWISNPESRNIVQHTRSRMDAVMIGSGTARLDNPLLTVRLTDSERKYPRNPLRIVLDSQAELPTANQLVQTAAEHETLIVTASGAPPQRIEDLRRSGCEVLPLPQSTPSERLLALLAELGNRRMTNLLVEGGGCLFGTLFDMQLIDEVHAFIAPKIIGGNEAVPVIGGNGVEQMPMAALLHSPQVQMVGNDIYIQGTVDYTKICDNG